MLFILALWHLILQILIFWMFVFLMLLCHLRLETLKLWNLHLNFLLFDLVPFNLTFQMLKFWMLTFPILLSHLKFETLKTWSFKTFTSDFYCVTLPSEFDISNFNILNVDISHVTTSSSLLIIKNKTSV